MSDSAMRLVTNESRAMIRFNGDARTVTVDPEVTYEGNVEDGIYMRAPWTTSAMILSPATTVDGVRLLPTVLECLNAPGRTIQMPHWMGTRKTAPTDPEVSEGGMPPLGG